MRLTIYGDHRAMALMALELADKQCDRVRDGLDKLQIDDMGVRAFQGLLGELRVALKDVKQVQHDWNFTQRRGLGVALMFYKAEVNKRRKGDEKLLIDPAQVIHQLAEISALLEELSGQETLFTKSTAWADSAEDDSDDTPRPDPVAQPSLAGFRPLDDAHA